MCKAHLVICWYNDVGFGSGGGAPPKAVAVRSAATSIVVGRVLEIVESSLHVRLDAPLFSN